MTPSQRQAALRLADESAPLPRHLLDIACRVRACETLYRDDIVVDEASHALKEALELLRELAAEPVQDEPVAWMDKYQIGGVRLTEAAYGLPHGAPLYPHPQQQRKPPTDELVCKVVRSVQPNLDDTCKAWGYEFAQCKYWLDAAHGITETP